MKATPIMLELVAVLAASTVNAATFYGSAAGASNGSMRTAAIKWYADQACTTSAGVVTPWDTGAESHMYVILGSKKIQDTDAVFPDVTVYIGTDGSTVGPSVVTQPELIFANSTLTFSSVTVFSGYFGVNNNNLMMKVLGNYTFAKTSQDIVFGGINIPSADTRGAELAGTFSAASDVVVKFSGKIGNQDASSYTVSAIKMTGDFSAYKGSFVCCDPIYLQYAKGAKNLKLDLISASAMGDISCERNDAYVLANNTHLTIASTVEQTSKRGITLSLSSSETAYLNAISGNDWTLTTPLYGSSGTLVKEGAGKLTMNSSTEIGNIVVNEGTLELGPDFSFSSGATVTVKSGAILLTSFPAGLNIVLENGAQYGLSPIPYNPETDETQPAALTAAQTWDGQLTVTLSNPITLPFPAEKRLALLTMPKSAKIITPADFAGATSRDDGLPVTHYEVDTDGSGMQTLYLIARPVIYATDPDQSNSNLLTETISRADGVYLWSDHQKAHGGADYVLGNGAYVRTATGYEERRVFPGESLELSGGSRLTLKTKEMFFTNLVMRGGTRLTTGGCGDGETPHQIQGRLCLPDANSEVPFVGGVDYSYSPGRKTTYNIEAEVVGNGWLSFGGQNMETDFFVTSTNPAFKGKMSIGVGVKSGCRSAICFWHPEALGGPLDAYDYQGIWTRAAANNGIKPMASMTYSVANRGLFLEEAGAFIETPEGVEFKFMNNVITKKGFSKKGVGTLALGGSVKVGSSPADATPTGNGERNKIDIDEGYLKAVNTNSYANLHLTFADGTGIAVDVAPTDPAVAEFGLFAPNAGLFVANGSIKVRIDGADALFASKATIRVPVCTVAGNTADLSKVFVGARQKGYACHMEKETLANGLIRYRASYVPVGMMIVIR